MNFCSNNTIIVPLGATNHGTQNLLCTPPSWMNYIVFYTASYISHVATLISAPGETWKERVMNTLSTLFIPSFGILRVIRHLFLHAGSQRKDELRRAARAGALCTIIAHHNTNPAGEHDEWIGKRFRGNRLLFKQPLCIPGTRRIHGLYLKPSQSYRKTTGPSMSLFKLPPETPLKALRAPCQLREGSTPEIQLSYSYNLPKVFTGLFQIIWGCRTLYKARGDQIARYGYSAFGLSVAPYVFMSLVNIAAALVTPQYPTMYLVSNPDMDFIRNNGPEPGSCPLAEMAYVNVPIAAIDVDSDEAPIDFNYLGLRSRRTIFAVILGLVLVAIPFICIGVLSSGFQTGNKSSASDRGWMMSWYVVQVVSSVWVFDVLAVMMPPIEHRRVIIMTMYVACIVPLWIPGIGGMITAGKMLKAYGFAS